MQEGLSPAAQFEAFARQVIPEGWSGNAIINASRELGFGINRSAALDVIRDARAELAAEVGRSGTLGELPGLPGTSEYKWGELVQQTDQWLRFDGPNSILFQNTGAQADEWLDYVIVPEDEEYISQRLVVEDDEYVDPDRPGSGYRTTEPLPPDISPAEAAQRLGIDPGKIARVIFDRP